MQKMRKFAAGLLTVTLMATILVEPSLAAAKGRNKIIILKKRPAVMKLMTANVTLKPDLIIQKAKITPSSVKVGEKINLYFEVKNIGNRNAENFYVKADDGLNWGTEIWMQRLIPRQTKIFNLFLTVTEAQLPGIHNFVFIADSRQNIMESNESNNTAKASVNIIKVVAEGTLTVNYPINPIPNQIVVPSTGDMVTYVTSARFNVKADKEDFKISRLGLQMLNGSGVSALKSVTIQYPTSLENPTNLNGSKTYYVNSSGSSGMGSGTSAFFQFNELDFKVAKDRTDVNFEVYVGINAFGKGTKGGEQIKIDFDGDATSVFEATGFSSGKKITSDNVEDISGNTISIIGITQSGALSILPPNTYVPSRVITPSTKDIVPNILASRFKVKADSVENFKINTLGIRVSNPDFSRAINKVTVKYPTNLNNPTLLNGEKSVYWSSNMSAGLFTFDNFFVAKGRDDIQFEVYFDLNPVGQGTNGGEVIQLNFDGDYSSFSAVGLSSGKEITPAEVDSVQGSYISIAYVK